MCANMFTLSLLLNDLVITSSVGVQTHNRMVYRHQDIPYRRLFSWVENFVKKHERSAEIIFVVLNFVLVVWGVDRG